MDTIIQTFHLTKAFKEDEIIKPLNFSLQQGEICALIGKNGAGKSTFFKMLSGQFIPTSGDIHLFGKSGKEMTTAQKRMGFMIETPEFFLILQPLKILSIFEFNEGSLRKRGFMKSYKLLV